MDIDEPLNVQARIIGGNLNIALNEISQSAVTLRIVDAVGRTFYEQQVQPMDLRSGEFEVRLPQLPRGVYFASIQTQTRIGSQAFVISR